MSTYQTLLSDIPMVVYCIPSDGNTILDTFSYLMSIFLDPTPAALIGMRYWVKAMNDDN